MGNVRNTKSTRQQCEYKRKSKIPLNNKETDNNNKDRKKNVAAIQCGKSRKVVGLSNEKMRMK